jgi:pimeloyl-ACP methyl ester carboxylesterase
MATMLGPQGVGGEGPKVPSAWRPRQDGGMPVYVLVHSPSVGPGTWGPVAARLRRAGREVVLPSLLGVGDGAAPYWPRAVAAVRDALRQAGSSQPAVLVPHSNAGLLLPLIAEGLEHPLAGTVFADASIPSDCEGTTAVEQEFVPFLRGLAGPDGLLPRWTDWWQDEDVAALLPDPAVRQEVVSEQPRLPLDFYLQDIPQPRGWAARPSGYLLFSAGYAALADQARERGWPVAVTEGEHLHQVVDPDGVARAITDLAASFG